MEACRPIVREKVSWIIACAGYAKASEELEAMIEV